MPPRSYVLVVNGRKVRQPVFVIGAPHSGADLFVRALKRSPGFHFTVGQPSVLSVVYAFARAPSIQLGRGEAAATVLRDAFAQSWQITDERDITRYGDATSALMYCAEVLVEAFPDAKIVQIIRDGRDVVAAMLSDPAELAWFRPGLANVETEFPNPFFGTESVADRDGWPKLSAAGKCAMRWRGCVHKMARLRNSLTAEQLTTFRYEQVIADPSAAAGALAKFIDAEVGSIEAPLRGKRGNGWRQLLSPAQLAEVERVAGQELRRVGYGA